jgi:hypothetical protein
VNGSGKYEKEKNGNGKKEKFNEEKEMKGERIMET